MHVNAKKIAIGGLLLALTEVCIALGSVIETNTLFLLAAASYFVGFLIRETDITETLVQEKKYRQLSKCYESMDASLRTPDSSEYDVRLREVHHRIKNNLQIIASILNLQARGCKDEYTKNILRENMGRVDDCLNS